jgi:YidC/Oxa1 family membrane protein insertase
VENTMIDCLNRASTAEWNGLSEQFSSLSADVAVTLEKLNEYNNFLGLNIANSPSFTMKDAFSTGNYLLIVGALMIPLMAALTQWINTKLMPQANTNSGNETADNMAQSMKTMNTIMPLMSAFFCFTLPAGMGLYWIAGAVVRSIQQVMINRHIDKMDINDVIKKNEAKAAKKIERMKASYENVSNYAAMKTKSVGNKASYVNTPEKDEALQRAADYYSKNAKPGSIAAKANMVKEYNEKNKR